MEGVCVCQIFGVHVLHFKWPNLCTALLCVSLATRGCRDNAPHDTDKRVIFLTCFLLSFGPWSPLCTLYVSASAIHDRMDPHQVHCLCMPVSLLDWLFHFGVEPWCSVKLLPCDHEVTDSSPENSLLQKCRARLRIKDPKWSDPSPDQA
jgi:hypothetical protein